MRNRVLITDPIDPSGTALLSAQAELITAPDAAPDTIRRLARDADAIIIRSRLPDDIFDAAPRVRAVTIHGTGTDLVPLESATKHAVMVANLPGGNAQSVAEYCVMAMLLLARNQPAIINALRTGTWDDARALGAHAHEIAEMALGLVGVGEIGKRVAKVCRKGFDMRVLGTQRRLDQLPPDAEPVTLDALLAESDFVVVACPLTPETNHMFNRHRFAQMKRTAWLINVGRGPVVEEDALIDALLEKRIAGAMLDVYEYYRIDPGHPLFGLENVILTPHSAGVTRESRVRMGVLAAQETLRMLSGEKPKNFVNPEVWDAALAR